MKMTALNLNMTLDFKRKVLVWSKLRMRSQKIAKMDKIGIGWLKFLRHFVGKRCR